MLAENIILTVLIIGVLVVVFAVLVMVLAFGWAMKDAGKNILGVIMLLGLSLGVPVGLYLVNQRADFITSANQQVKVVNIEAASVEKGVVLVNITTDRKALVYLKYKDTLKDYYVPILPTSNYELSLENSFIISQVGNQGGVIQLMINDREVPAPQGQYRINF